VRSGQFWAILEVISKDKVFVEFCGKDRNQIEWKDELVFELDMSQFKVVE